MRYTISLFIVDANTTNTEAVVEFTKIRTRPTERAAMI